MVLKLFCCCVYKLQGLFIGVHGIPLLDVVCVYIMTVALYTCAIAASFLYPVVVSTPFFFLRKILKKAQNNLDDR